MSRSKQKSDSDPGVIRYEGYVSIGLVGCRRKFEFELPADADEREIEETAKDAMFNFIEWD